MSTFEEERLRTAARAWLAIALSSCLWRGVARSRDVAQLRKAMLIRIERSPNAVRSNTVVIEEKVMQKSATLVFVSALSLIACGTNGYEVDEPATEALSIGGRAAGLGSNSQTPASSAVGSKAQNSLGAGSAAATPEGVDTNAPTPETTLALGSPIANTAGQVLVVGIGMDEIASAGASDDDCIRDDSQWVPQTFVVPEDGLVDSVTCVSVPDCRDTRCPSEQCPGDELCSVGTAQASAGTLGLGPCNTTWERDSVSNAARSDGTLEALPVETQPWPSVESEREQDEASEELPSLI